MSTHRALGRGLNALLPEAPTAVLQEATLPPSQHQLMRLRLEQIRPNPFQPRIEFDQSKLDELMASIRERGLIQPVIVRHTSAGYELVAGERRFRAAKALGWTEIPAIVRPANNQEALELSLLENIQRADLNPIEEALAYQRLAMEFGMTQELIAQATGKQRSSITNMLRLLKLPERIKQALQGGLITAGHAKALVSVEDQAQQLALFERLLTENISVRTVEHVTRQAKPAARRRVRAGDPNLRALEERLQQALGTRVNIMHGQKRGQIVIEYYSTEDLQRLAEQILA